MATDDVFVVVLSNEEPVADAGADQDVHAGADGNAAVTLDGTGSTDDGEIATYAWAVDGVSAEGATAEVALPVGVHAITLTVTDNAGLTATDEVTITVIQSGLPVAVAGEDILAPDADGNGSEAVALDGSASSDPEGEALTYEWQTGDLTQSGAIVTFDLPVGEHVVTLTVRDPSGNSGTDDVKVSVVATLPPTADAGSDASVSDANGDGTEVVALDASGASDPDGTIVSYQWSSGGVVLAEGAIVEVTLPVGEHAILLTVTDNGGAADSDEVAVRCWQRALPWPTPDPTRK